MAVFEHSCVNFLEAFEEACWSLLASSQFKHGQAAAAAAAAWAKLGRHLPTTEHLSSPLLSTIVTVDPPPQC